MRCVKRSVDLDAVEREYLSGVSSSEIAKRVGVKPGTISRWMRQRGIHLGKGAHQSGANKPELAERHKQAEREFARRLHDEFGGRFEYVGGFRENGRKFATVRCSECGTEFEHYIGFQGAEWTCPTCQKAKAEDARKRLERQRKAQRVESEMREYSLDKTCLECGATFHSKYHDARYCSDGCRRRSSNRRSAIRRRERGTRSDFGHYYRHRYGNRYRDVYDPTISLRALHERDGGVCQICGDPCDWDDREWGRVGPMYPSIDHIVPRSNGGAHTWDNVQLAHCICNSRKRDLPNDVAVSETTAYG